MGDQNPYEPQTASDVRDASQPGPDWFGLASVGCAIPVWLLLVLPDVPLSTKLPRESIITVLVIAGCFMGGTLCRRRRWALFYVLLNLTPVVIHNIL